MTGGSSQPFSAPKEDSAPQRQVEVSFQDHIRLLGTFLAHRDDIVECIQGLLNAQRKPVGYLQGGPQLSRDFEDCFFRQRGVSRDQLRLRGRLREAHWASGFRPRKSPGLFNDLVDPAEMMVRAFHLWRQTHWPGHSGRARYAQTLFNLYVIRDLVLLTMRLWDSAPSDAGLRLSQIQDALDHLWSTTPDDQPVLVGDARWLIPVAQSPTTDELRGYFIIGEHVAETLSAEDRNAIHTASVRTGGGHLRSQLRHVSIERGVPVDDERLVLSTRQSNALDFALLIQGLVPILEAYEHARDDGDREQALERAATICQGISPDPEMLLNRLDLLGPYSMIEHLFITADDDGQVAYTPMGRRHRRLVEEYKARIRRLAAPLHEDCQHSRPVEGTYSPYGVLYGFSSNLLEHMALKTVDRDAATQFSLEDVFSDGDADKLAWVSGWRKLPHITPEAAKLFEYPQQFAEKIFARVEDELRQCGSKEATGEAADGAARTGRLYVVSANGGRDSDAAGIPDLPSRYFRSSDPEIVAAGKAKYGAQNQILHSRFEGEFLLSYPTSGGWIAITKDVLTEILGAGRDAKIVGLPRAARKILALMCPDLVVLEDL